MQLLSSRWQPTWMALVLAFFVVPMLGYWLGDGIPRPLLGPMIAVGMIGLPTLVYFYWPQHVIASVDGPTVRIGGKSARLADLTGVQIQTLRVNLIPASRTLILSFRATESDGMIARALSVRKLMLAVGNIAGGRKAAGAFAEQLLGAAQGGSLPPPPNGTPPARAGTATPNIDTRSDDSFDPDAIIARYLATRADAPPASSSTPRPTFGRKGV